MKLWKTRTNRGKIAGNVRFIFDKGAICWKKRANLHSELTEIE